MTGAFRPFRSVVIPTLSENPEYIEVISSVQAAYGELLMVTPPPPEECGKAKWQSKQKHAFLEAYLKIWTDHVGKKSGTKPSLDIVDLYASYGWCHDKETGKTWEGTAVLCARYLKAYGTTWGKRLVLNSYHPDSSENERQLALLQKAISAEGVPDKETKVFYNSQSAAEAAEWAKKWHVRPDYPNLWILDPYQPEDLPWPVVEGIIRNVGALRPGKKEGTFTQQKPEVLINLMTMSLQRNVDINPKLISITFGMPEDEWRPMLAEYKTFGLNTRDALVEMYITRLQAVYGKRPHSKLVKGAEGAIIYAVIFCTDNDAGYYMMAKEAIPKYEEWFENKWRPPAEALAGERREKRQIVKQEKQVEETRAKHHSLDEFF